MDAHPLMWWLLSCPIGFADIVPGDYARHANNGTITPKFKDKLLALAQGNVNLGVVPMFDGHLWDSMRRVLIALGLGIALGVPPWTLHGVSNFFRSFFDPLIETLSTSAAPWHGRP